MAYACETGKTYGFTDVFELHIKRLRYFINKTHEINTNEHLCLDNPEKKTFLILFSVVCKSLHLIFVFCTLVEYIYCNWISNILHKLSVLLQNNKWSLLSIDKKFWLLKCRQKVCEIHTEIVYTHVKSLHWYYTYDLVLHY